MTLFGAFKTKNNKNNLLLGVICFAIFPTLPCKHMLGFEKRSTRKKIK